MSDPGLYDLYCVHLVDSRLLDLKKQAGALDSGKVFLQQYNDLKAEHLADIEGYESSLARQKGLLERANIARDKVSEVETMLYSGKIANPREVMAYQEEMKGLTKKADENEFAAMEIEEGLPDAKAIYDSIQTRLRALAVQYKKKKEHDAVAYGQIKVDFEAATKERPALIARVPAPLLAQYEAICKKSGGVGMGVVTAQVCGACRTNLPERVLIGLKEDRLVTCEECRRILFRRVA